MMNKMTLTGPRDSRRPFQQFAQASSLSGVILLAAATVALIWANCPWKATYFALWDAKVVFGPAEAPLVMSVHDCINEMLMVVFFLLVGLEIKREVLVGELSSLRQAALPLLGAIGGMVVPAALYAAFNADRETAHGWGIPMATDIAFALGILTLMGQRCPLGLKVFLTALAIVDDLGGIVVIAGLYSGVVDVNGLLASAGLVALLLLLNRMRVRVLAPYLAVGLVLWFAVHASGIPATVAGVLLAFTLPVRTRINAAEFSQRARAIIDEFDRAETGDLLVITSKGQQEAIHALESESEGVQAPILRLEHALHGVVAFGIMPLFAFANAGLDLGQAAWPWQSSVGAGVLLGLLVGKPLGIMLFSILAVRTGLAALPRETSWTHIHGAGWLAGIGFTVSLFVARLSFTNEAHLDAARLGILGASLLAGAIGATLLLRTAGTSKTDH